MPRPEDRDILVRVAAVGVNPVDTKVFARLAPGEERILGFDACGVVTGVGPKARCTDRPDRLLRRNPDPAGHVPEPPPARGRAPRRWPRPSGPGQAAACP